MSFQLDEVSCLRVLDHEHIDAMMQRRQEWREMAQQRWVNGRQHTGVILSSRSYHKDIGPETVDHLHQLARVLLAAVQDFKLVVSINQAWLYTNDVRLFDTLDQLPILKDKTYGRARVNRPRDTVLLANSVHDSRSYFKVTKLTATQKTVLVAFLQAQSAHVRLSPGLETWMRQSFNRTQDYFFVDYTGASWLTMLNLVHSGLIRKTLKIVTAK